MNLVRLFTFLLTLSPFATAGLITCNAPGNLSFTGRSDGSANAFFYPANGSLSQTAAGCLGPGAHFNWYQIVTVDPMPPRNANVPYIDPQPGGNATVVGGWRDGFPWYYDEAQPGSGIGCNQGGVNTCQFYDPIAWQVTSPCITYLSGHSCPIFNYTPTRDILAYSDTPQNPQAQISLSFQTRVVAVSADESNWAYIAGFAWDWSNVGNPFFGVSSNFRSLSPAELLSPPPARQGGGPPPPFLVDPPAHSSLGFPPNPLLQPLDATTSIPEPSALALTALGVTSVLLRYRTGKRRG